MEREFVGLHIAIVAVSDAESVSADPPSQLVIERLGAAGHKLVHQTKIDDNVQLIRAKLLEHIADTEVDIVVLLASTKTESAGLAIDPLVTRPLHGFSDLLRMIAYQEMGSAAMLVDAEAAQCKSTFVFILPGSVPSVRLALDKLLLPQLDYRTKPRNVVMSLPRIEHTDSGDEDAIPEEAPKTETAKSAAPWIVPRPPGDAPPVPTVFPPQRPSQQIPAARTSMSMSIAQPLPKASVSDIVEKTAVSVSQRLSAVANPFEARETTNVGPPPAPPPLPRGKVSSTISTPLPNKPPAKLIPLAALLPVPAESTDAPAKDSPAPSVVVDKELSAPVAEAEPSRKMSSLADLDDEGDDLDELDNDVAEIIDEPPKRDVAAAAPAQIDEPKRDEPRAAARASIAPADLPARRSDEVSPIDDPPRRYAEPPLRKRRDGKKLALLLLGILFAGAAGVATVLLLQRKDREAQAANDPPRTDLVAANDPALAPMDPPVTEPPPTNPAPTEAFQPSADVIQPSEIDMSAPPADPPQTTTQTPPSTTMQTSPPPTGQTTPRAPRTPRTPREPITEPVRDPADVLATAPVNKVEDGCDEVSCILDKYKQVCCARFKPPEPEVVPEKPPSGLPEKLDKLMVQEGIAAVKPAVIACGEQFAVKGTVKVQVKVSPSGRVVSANVTSAPDPQLGSCVAAAVRLAKFPETDEGASFGYPFVF